MHFKKMAKRRDPNCEKHDKAPIIFVKTTMSKQRFCTMCVTACACNAGTSCASSKWEDEIETFFQNLSDIGTQNTVPNKHTFKMLHMLEHTMNISLRP